jgi:hypothetical protein
MITYERNLAHKLKRERLTVCLNCKRFAERDEIGKFEECVDFEEVKCESWVMRRL